MKTKKQILVYFFLFSIAFLSMRCQHDNEEVVPVKGPDPIVHGEETLGCTECASTDAPAGGWYFDKAHSNVMWETSYKVFGSMLTGRFNYFVVEELNFDEADPSAITFKGYVWLNSVNTGEPGRDGGCLLTTFGTTSAKTSETENIARIESEAGTGKYSATDAGFIVDAELTFNGVTKPVTIKLIYHPQSLDNTLAGISAEFDFLAKSIFGIESTNIADKVTVKMNLTFKKKA